jgi:hypothetical protein
MSFILLVTVDRLSRYFCCIFHGINIFHLNSTSCFEKSLVSLVHVNVVIEVLNDFLYSYS